MNQFLRSVFFLILTILLPLPTIAQTLKFFDVDKSQFPIMKAKFYAFDATNKSVRPPLQDLAILEDGKTLPIMSVVCTPDPEPPALSSVIMVDISGSMSTKYSNHTGLDLARTAATAWIQGLPQGLSEAAIGSFNDRNFINVDFTTNKQSLLSTLTTLYPTGGTDYNKGLLEPFAGALQLSKNAKYQKIIIYITDGLPNFEPDVKSIIHEAQGQQCMIFAITLGLPCPTSLKEISTQTGGQYFENVTTLQEAETLYLRMLKSSQLAEPCEIVWQSTPSCTQNTKTVTLEWNGLAQNATYTVDAAKLSGMKFAPEKILFNSFAPIGQPHDTTITVTALLSGFVVKSITSSEPTFEISPKQFTLKAGESIPLTVRYTPKDSAYHWSEFTFDTDICPQSYFVAGRYITKKTIPEQKNTIQLSYPNGEEILVAGSDTKIRWNGIPATDQVLLELSNDNAATWTAIGRNKSGLEHAWRVPNKIGSQCRVRVSQTLEKPSEVTSDIVNCLGHTDCIRKVVWSPDGALLLTAGMDGKAIIWNAIDGSIIHTISSKYTAITHVEWSPDGKYIATAGVDDSVFIWEATTGKKYKSFPLEIPVITTISWNTNGSTLLICGQDGGFNLWNVDAGTFSRYTILSGGNWVNFAKWSPDGKSIALCTENLNTVIVWDAITLQEKLRVSGHTKNVRHVAWSPDGKKLATASGDKLVKISDASTGTVLSTLVGHSQLVSEVAWSPDGQYVASASDDLTCNIWDPLSGNRIQELVGHTGILTHLEWSPKGNQIATSSGDNTAKVWDVYTGSIDKTVTHKGYLTYISWNPTGNRIATSSCDFKATVWNVNPSFIPFQMDMSDTVFSIVAPTPLALDVDMGRLSVGSSKDTVVNEFLINTGTYPYRVDSIRLVDGGGIHTSEFTVVEQQYPIVIPVGGSRFGEFLFHPTSQGLKTVSILIYTQAEILTKTISGEGTVDSVEIQGVPIAFGPVDVGKEKDIQKGYVLVNHASTPVTVTITETGPNEIDYSIINNITNITLNPGDKFPVDVRFAPSSIGRTGGGLNFDFGGKRAPALMQLFGEGVPNSPLLAQAYSVNMGKIVPGDEKDSIGILMVRNKSAETVLISSIEVKGTNPEDFTFLNNGTLTLKPQETLALDIRFAPKSLGNKYAELVMTPQGGGSPIAVTVMGKGVEGASNSVPATATLRVGDGAAHAGDTINLPLLRTASKNLLSSKAVEFRGSFHFSTSSLMPIGTSAAVVTQNNKSSFAFSCPINHSKDTQITFSFRVLPSIDTVTEVGVEGLLSVGGKVAITSENGTFSLLPSRKDTTTTGGKDTTSGGKPGITFEQIQLGPLAPNPAGNTANLTVRIIEKGATTLQLVDINGSVVKTFITKDLPVGLSMLRLDVQDVAIGKYFIVLQTPTQRRTLQMEIQR